MNKAHPRKPPGASPRVDREPASGRREGADLLAECRVDTFRSGGKGGQHQNKVESGVRLTHRPTGLVAVSRKHRSQRRNREAALARLQRKLEARNRRDRPRAPTRVPEREKRRRLEEKRRRSRVKRLRAAPDRED